MGKGIETRQHILTCARNLFQEKGYLGVSMSDICQATSLSRGGLYRHYSSVGQIFIGVLKADKDPWEQDLEKAIHAQLSARKIITAYLDALEQGIIAGNGRLSLCAYEYFRSEPEPDAFIVSRFDIAAEMLERLLTYGQKRHELKPDFDPGIIARFLVINLDGLAIAYTVQKNPGLVKEQINQLKGMVTK